MGKPTTFTQAIAAEIIAEVALGMPLKHAADWARVPRSTFAEWRERGAKPREVNGEVDPRDAPLVAFVVELNRARAQFVRGALRKMVRGDKAWQAVSFLLERLHPDEFGKQDRVIVERRVGEELDGVLDALRAGLSAEEYERALRAIDCGGPGEASTPDAALDA